MQLLVAGRVLACELARDRVGDHGARLSMKTLIALCDIFDCTPNDLITPYAVSGQQPKAAAGGPADVVELNRDLRPERARITDEV